jgi:hypothetical protein
MTNLTATAQTITAPVPSAKIKVLAGQPTNRQLVKQVKRLPWVKRARLRWRPWGTFLIIKTYPYAVDTKGYAERGFRHKIPGMKIKIRLTDKEGGDRTRAYHSEYVKLWGKHPHIARLDRKVCWGSGATPMTDAVRRNDMYSLIVTVGFWLINPNYNDSYNRRFNETSKPVGWIKPKRPRWFRSKRNGV